jgi:hypothetical protein
MKTTLPLLMLAALAASLPAQQTILFTGRFPFVSLDDVNERPGGAITRLEEFDFSYVVPAPACAARTLLPATAMHCYLGDGDNNGTYTKFAGFKTYFENIQIGGLFVRAADVGNVTWDKVYFTVRDNVAGKDIEVLTNNGTTVHTLVPGDWVRLLPNGNVEFFATAAQFAVAAGSPPSGQATVPGAHALLQTPAGDLYYAPVQGGQWVNGNSPGPVFANDGAICKIDAAAITYDAAGNIASIAPNSARVVIEETNNGPSSSPLTTRGMVLNSGAYDRTGAPIAVAGVFGKISGLAFDPQGGTFLARWPDANGVFQLEPNLLFCSDAGSYAGSIFSTNNNGSVAVINGVLCGSTTPGVPADGAWLGVRLDVPNFQPSLMGFQLVGPLPSTPLVIDQNGLGRLPVQTSQPQWLIDAFSDPSTLVFFYISLGPTAPGGFVPSVPTAFVPLPWATGSWNDIYLVGGIVSLGVVFTDAFGYGTLTLNNPNNGTFPGVTLMVQGIGLQPTGFQLTTPLLVQLN